MLEFGYEMVTIYQQKIGDTIGFKGGDIIKFQEKGREIKS